MATRGGNGVVVGGKARFGGSTVEISPPLTRRNPLVAAPVIEMEALGFILIHYGGAVE